MANGKKGVLVYADWNEKFESLTDEEAGKLIKHFFRYVNDENPIAPDRFTEVAFIDIKQSLKRDLKKWEERAERSRENGKNGGRPPKDENLEKPTETQRVILKPEKPDTVSVNGSVIVSDTTNKLVGIGIDQHQIFKAECLISHQWLEQVSMNLKIPIEKIHLALTDFHGHLITIGENKKDLNDYKFHFVNWARILKNKKDEQERKSKTDRL